MEVTDRAQDWIAEHLPEDELVTLIEECKLRAERFVRTAESLETILHARRRIVPSTVAKPARSTGDQAADGSRPPISVAIVRVLADAPDQTLSATAIVRALQARGWAPTNVLNLRKSVGAALSRLVNETRQVRRVGRGLYKLAADPPQQPFLLAPHHVGSAENGGAQGTASGMRESDPIQGGSG